MEQSTCVQSGHRYRGSCSLPCDGQRPCDHSLLLRAFRCAEPEHCYVQQVRCDVQLEHYDVQRASTHDGQRRSEGHDGCFRPCR